VIAAAGRKSALVKDAIRGAETTGLQLPPEMIAGAFLVPPTSGAISATHTPTADTRGLVLGAGAP
jgi:hypothetical protein